MRDIITKTALCSVYIDAPDTLTRDRIWSSMRRALRTRDPDAGAVYQLSRLLAHKRPAGWKPLDHRIVTQAEREALNPPSDIIIIAHHLRHVDQRAYDHLIDDIHEIRMGHPNSLIAVHFSHDKKDPLVSARCHFAFNARAAGVALIYGAQGEQISHGFRTMLDALVRRQIRKPITTPDFISVPQDPTIRLGDVLITRKLNTRTPGSVVNGHTNTTLTGFKPQSIQLLWALAAHQGTYFNHTDQQQFPHFNSALRVLQEDLSRKRLGRVHTLYNLGYVVEGEDFRIHTYAPEIETKDYPFQYHRAGRLLAWGPRQVTLSPLEGTLFEKLADNPGVTLSKDQLVSGRSDISLKVAMNKLRSKLDGISPVNPDGRISLQFIETHTRLGWRMLPAGELRLLIAQYSEKQRQEASRVPSLSAHL